MKITILNASPKGKNSVTFQSIRYLEKHFPKHTYTSLHIGQKINAIGKDSKLFKEILEDIKTSDVILWAYPVYTFMVPYQLVKFIELIENSGNVKIFNNKYTAQISTSKHFYDHTAYNYLHNICEDWSMQHIHGLCADMDDLTMAVGRQQLLTFADAFFNAIETQTPVSKKYYPSISQPRRYNSPVDKKETPKSEDYRVVLITDCTEEDHNLKEMIKTFQKTLPVKLDIFNLSEFEFQGGCLGCFQCAFEGKCIYNDGFDIKHRELVLNADSMILAASINHHWFNAVWKCFDDRQFYNGHRTSMMGKSIGYIISGNLRQEANLREILEARSEVGHLYLMDIVTDEYDNDENITQLLESLADKTIWALKNKPQRPQNFLGIGGMKVFRDLIYIMRGLMQEDHRFYKENGLYDFPHKKVGMILLMQFLGLLMKSKKSRKRMGISMNKYLLMPYQKALGKDQVNY
ncbi:MAG: NAD(P)H-dependent oxidoreductase [Anaerolineaceae bacterium]|nr:NAD(P)H-dependent oxidoreductase [Anaerolineaceae bacterium]